MSDPKGSASKYQPIAAGQTATVLKSSGSGEVGDFITRILVIPATTSHGAMTLIDGSSSIVVFVGGAVVDVKPFEIPLEMASKSTAWKITTGANVSVVCNGKFT
jgi:hypothetical protein